MFERIVEIISDYQGIEKDTITAETYLISDLGLNSYDVVALATRFEDEFNIDIPDRAIKKLQTVDDISVQLSALLQ